MSSEAPPTYQQATGSSNSSGPAGRNGIPAQRRRSMEDENRPLPHGWVRQFDPQNRHQFFVDTNAKPPRSIWHHPYDDEQYLSSLPIEERERLEELTRQATNDDHLRNMSSSESMAKHAPTGKAAAAGVGAGYLSDPRSSHGASGGEGSSSEPAPKGIKKFGRNLKDKMTGTTHEQRIQERRDREIQEQREYEMHQRVRAAMARAMETGQPQLIGKDSTGKDVYIEPPSYGGPGGYYGGGGDYYGGGGYGGGGYGYNPYQRGPYTQTSNAVYVRPDYPYSRPYGSGYGGGMGMPLAAGFLGGALLGGLLF